MSLVPYGDFSYLEIEIDFKCCIHTLRLFITSVTKLQFIIIAVCVSLVVSSKFIFFPGMTEAAFKKGVKNLVSASVHEHYKEYRQNSLCFILEVAYSLLFLHISSSCFNILPLDFIVCFLYVLLGDWGSEPLLPLFEKGNEFLDLIIII